MTWLPALIVGLAVGAAAGWLLARTRAATAEGAVAELRAQSDKAQQDFAALRGQMDAERETRVKAETELAEARRSFEEQRKLLDEARTKLADTFKAVSSEALQANSQAFTQRADEVLKPLRERLKEYEEHVRDLEKTRKEAYGGLNEQLKALTQTHQQLMKETHGLSTALRSPQARGAWGEMVLRRVVELAGMTKHCDFSEQVTADGGGARPDMVVHLPGGRQVVVDSKAPIDEYRRAVAAESEQQRQDLLKRHARRMREHMTALSRKGYWREFAEAAEFVVMFIPGESFFGAAVEHDATLIEDGMRSGVVLATPTTLIALLQAVGYGWRQESLAESAREVSELGSQLYERIGTFAGHLRDVGTSLARATEAYNRAVGSAETRVLPAARRFRELGVSGKSDLPELAPVEPTPRGLTAPEMRGETGAQ
jgi:DNA recombination protein RmuC